MEKRFDVSYLMSNGKGCGLMESKAFIGEDMTIETVKEFIEELKAEAKKDGCFVQIRVYEGWGMNQRRIEIQ